MIEEYDETGACVMSAQYGTEDSMQGYRAYRAPWVGRPRTKPSVVACKADQGTGTKVYVSWNGATDVSAWKVYGGSGEGSMKVVKTVGKNGFETKALVEDDIGGGKVMVQAVGGVGDGRMSEVVSIGQGC